MAVLPWCMLTCRHRRQALHIHAPAASLLLLEVFTACKMKRATTPAQISVHAWAAACCNACHITMMLDPEQVATWNGPEYGKAHKPRTRAAPVGICAAAARA